MCVVGAGALCRPTGPRRMVALRHVFALACFTVVLHVVSISFFYAPPSERSTRPSAAATAAAAAAAAASPGHSPPPLELLLVTATQPAPCTTLHGDHMVQLALKNKWQHAGGLTSATARLGPPGPERFCVASQGCPSRQRVRHGCAFPISDDC